MDFKYDPTFPIRGLYYDKSKGCLMKLDFFGSIEPDGCYFGRRKVLATDSFASLVTYMCPICIYCYFFFFLINYVCGSENPNKTETVLRVLYIA